jgi:hypothetical protein
MMMMMMMMWCDLMSVTVLCNESPDVEDTTGVNESIFR